MANERRRLVDATQLDILGYLEEFPICDEDEGWNAAMNSAFAHVVCAPTVDAVEVVRCKHCMHWMTEGNGYLDDSPYCGNPDGIDGYTKPDDFCSYGERRPHR